METIISKLKGTGVALITPFTKDLKVDFEGLKNLLSHTINNGVNYLVVNGTTAESPTTTEAEKTEILAFIKKEVNGKVPLVFGIGGNYTEEVLQKIKKTDLDGISALLSVSPYYNKPSQEGIYQHYKAIAETSPVPVIIYNVPGRTGSNIAAKTTVRLSQLKNIIGTKEASGDILQCLEIARDAEKDFLLISGDDMMTLPMISFGAHGVISVLANAFPKKFSQMVKLSLEGDFKSGTDIYKAFLEINPLMYEEGNPIGIKTVLANIGVCSDAVRLPLVSASEGLKNRIKVAFEKL